MTPFLLERFHRDSHGASLTANVAIILANAGLAGPDRGGRGAGGPDG